MICRFCGEEIKENAEYCPFCAKASGKKGKKKHRERLIEAPGMLWYRFQIKLGLFLETGVYFICAMLCFTGKIGALYESGNENLCDYFPALRTLNAFWGVAMLGLAASALLTRNQLAECKRKGPRSVIALYAAGILLGILYLIVMDLITGELADRTLINLLVLYFLYLIWNYRYYYKRLNYFTK